MDTNKNQQPIENFTEKYLNKIPLDSPSSDFTKNVMSALQTQKSGITKYVPLIGWKAWLSVAVILLVLFFIPFESSENRLLDSLRQNISIPNSSDYLPTLDNFSISSTTFYAFLLFGIMISIQVFYLKGYFEKRYQS